MIKSYNVFKVQKKKSKEEIERENQYWNSKTLLPNEDDFGIAFGIEYHHKTLCDFASGGDSIAYRKYYEDLKESEVWDRIAIIKAMNY